MFVFGVFTAVYVEGQIRKLSFFPKSAGFHERSTKDLAFLAPMNFPRGCKYLQGKCAGKKNLVSVILWAIKNAFGRTGTREDTLTPAIRYGPFHLGGEHMGLTPPLQKLIFALAVVRELHFSRAARRLTISQPYLSRTIREFEGELRFLLFRRNRRVVEVTA